MSIVKLALIAAFAFTASISVGSVVTSSSAEAKAHVTKGKPGKCGDYLARKHCPLEERFGQNRACGQKKRRIFGGSVLSDYFVYSSQNSDLRAVHSPGSSLNHAV